MKIRNSRSVCPHCGSVGVERKKNVVRCLNCGHASRKFPLSTDPVISPSDWDGRERDGNGRIVPNGGAE